MKKIIYFLILFILISSGLFAQQTRLLFKKGGFLSGDKFINIYLSSEKGNPSVTSETISNFRYLCFTYKPVGDWDFKEKDIDDLEKISIKKDGKQIQSVEISPIAEFGDIIMVIAHFSKTEISFSQPFIFHNEFGSSSELYIDENLWPYYSQYNKYYTDGKNYLDKNNYFKSFDCLKKFLIDNEEIVEFSFYEDSRKLLIDTIEESISKENKNYQYINIELQSSPGEIVMSKLDSLKNSLEKAQSKFSEYFNYVSDEKSKKLSQRLDDLVATANKKLTEARTSFKSEKLSLFEKGNYQEDKFKMYIDLLARICCYRKYIDKLSGLDTLDINLIQKFSDKKNKLETFGLLDDFMSMLKLVNKNISHENYILNTKAIKHLSDFKNVELEPYFDIFMAFNSFGEGKLELFAQYVNNALEKCTDQQLLSFLEIWYLSYTATKYTIDEEALKSIEKGISYETNGDFVGAEEQFKKAKMRASRFAPPRFYLGRLNFKKNDKFTAERYFSQAIEIYPEYIAPRKYKLDFLIEQGDYSLALNEVNSALENCKLWYFYYIKAKILYYSNDYSKAKDIILDKCIKINAYNFDEYILFGDIYLELTDKINARKYYEQAGDIEPENPIFSDRMKKLLNN